MRCCALKVCACVGAGVKEGVERQIAGLPLLATLRQVDYVRGRPEREGPVGHQRALS